MVPALTLFVNWDTDRILPRGEKVSAIKDRADKLDDSHGLSTSSTVKRVARSSSTLMSKVDLILIGSFLLSPGWNPDQSAGAETAMVDVMDFYAFPRRKQQTHPVSVIVAEGYFKMSP